ncbi:MAG: sulfocyanin [Saccharolobus sp.]
MKINKIGLAVLGVSVAILIIGGVFFGLAAVPYHVITTNTATTTSSSITTSSAPKWG